MKYTIFLWPHANVRYRNESRRLAAAELGVMLRRLSPDAAISEDAALEIPALSLERPEPLDPETISALRDLSWLYGIFERREDGALIPLAGRKTPWLGEDLPGILKYKGKTNELFTQLLTNAALYAGDYWRTPQRIRMLDPMCGRGTTLFVGANRGWDSVGTDVDRGDLQEAERFFKRYLEYGRFKHTLERRSLTMRGGEGAQCAEFTFSDSPEHFKQKQIASLRLVNADATRVCEVFGPRAFHLIVCDLPYGVQHSAQGGAPERLLARCLDGWRDALKPGGTVAVSFNAQTFKRQKALELMEAAGLEPMRGGPYEAFSHWVEQAVTRDIAVGRKI